MIAMTPRWLEELFAADDALNVECDALMRKIERYREHVEQEKRGPSLETLQRMAQEHRAMMRRLESDPAYIQCVQENRKWAIVRLQRRADEETVPEERKRILGEVIRRQKEYYREMRRCITQQACECGGASCEKCGGGN